VKRSIKSKNLPLVAGSNDGGKVFGEWNAECEILKISVRVRRGKADPANPYNQSAR
jgi:hypothetical protein